MTPDEFYMREALKEAHKAFDADEIPVGAVIVHNDKIIARAHNQIKLLKDPTAHAEMIALTQAASYLNNERLINTRAYVTIEPCAMCCGAFILSRIKYLVYGAPDPKTGACGSVFNIVNNKKLNHRIKVKKGILEEDCGSLLKEFFRKKREKKRERLSPSPH
ncbi:MAG: tRNA adenosine(34) deaminase TadA [Candidatus Omnitrophica bacterium CG07_land_8_20_14_0_80_42_15]|uniref:tRNA-specific adenosine deaminase n=1 Tax=Candidatus Aquitaenariimonas noxiae TaxID=1974741 RepID=A0A2J0KTR0_9BACT|nr:MAG: tRNA adenosine(34) deaminase TadA [Candidatus Omnitrophica bacterium CG07_land_8_20_14_0_80_42_15]